MGVAGEREGPAVDAVDKGAPAQRLGRAQRFVLERLSMDPVRAVELARAYFGVDEPTAAQRETVRRAMRTLAGRGLAVVAFETSYGERRAGPLETPRRSEACRGVGRCSACFYGAAWYAPDGRHSEEFGYHQWQPRAGSVPKVPGRSRATVIVELAARLPLSAEEREARAEALAETMARVRAL